MMKIILLILLSLCTLLNAEQPRYKHRGPPPRRRSPPTSQFSKKWHQGGPLIQGKLQGIPLGMMTGYPQGPHQHPTRNGPMRPKLIYQNNIPLQSTKIQHKIPLGIPQNLQRPAPPPVRTFWKNPVNNVQFPPEKVYKPKGPPPQLEKQKPFRSAPSLPVQDFDYQVQTNQIPQLINPIKQIGEKGPIHTIPAPNLSIKDKPANLNEGRHEYKHHYPQQEIKNDYNNHYQQQEINNHYIQQEVKNEVTFQHNPQYETNFGQRIPQSTHVTIQKSHEYQVTEAPEQNQKVLRAQQDHQRQIQLQIQKQIEQMQKQNAQDAQSQQILVSSEGIPVQHQNQNNGDIILSNNLSPKELFHIVNANYPQTQQTQQLDHIQLFQPDAGFIEQFPQETISGQIALDKLSFQPEYHSFNYDEQAHQKSMSKKDMSSLVSATYNLGVDTKDDSDDSIAQSEMVQNYFDSRSDVIENKIDDSKNDKGDGTENKIVGTYYSSLPNKETAERLAQLQTAGKINSNLMKLSPDSNSKEPMTILIPDDNSNEESSSKEDSPNKSNDFNEYENEEDDESLVSDEVEQFGHRIQPKKKAS